MEDAKTKKKSRWHHCHCGVIFQKDKPSGIYDEKYLKDFEDGGQKYKDACQYPVKIYAPIIEELMYGRKVLIVGSPTQHQVEAFRDRGWVAYSIDKNEAIKPSNRHIVGDIETYEFSDDIKFNLIWFNQTLECLADPTNTLKKCFTSLPEDGMVVIMTPDADFVHTRSSSAFVNWKPEFNNVMWNKRSLTSHLEKLGFSVIMARRNYEHRFAAVDDIHVLAQKSFF